MYVPTFSDEKLINTTLMSTRRVCLAIQSLQTFAQQCTVPQKGRKMAKTIFDFKMDIMHMFLGVFGVKKSIFGIKMNKKYTYRAHGGI